MLLLMMLMCCEGKSKPKQSWQEVKLVYKHVDLNSKLYVWELQNAHPHLKCEDTFYLDFWGESVGLFFNAVHLCHNFYWTG